MSEELVPISLNSEKDEFSRWLRDLEKRLEHLRDELPFENYQQLLDELVRYTGSLGVHLRIKQKES